MRTAGYELEPSSQLHSSKKIDWFRLRLLDWFSDNGRDFLWRRPSASKYVKIVSEVLLQRTRADVVAEFLPKFIKRYPSWTAIASGKSSDLRKHLKPIGLWRRRASSLENLATEMAKRRGVFPRRREEIEKLPNVGQYIANAILLFCHGQPEPLLDVNMARVLERFFGPRTLADIRYDPYLQSLAKAFVNSRDPVLLNWAILDHATLLCRITAPRCLDCPLLSKCRFAKENDLV
jgi:A/G-specific adenine glycosylase